MLCQQVPLGTAACAAVAPDLPALSTPDPARYSKYVTSATMCSKQLLLERLPGYRDTASSRGCYTGSLPTNLISGSQFRESPLQPRLDNPFDPSVGAGSTLGSSTLACTQLITCQPWPCPALQLGCSPHLEQQREETPSSDPALVATYCLTFCHCCGVALLQGLKDCQASCS